MYPLVICFAVLLTLLPSSCKGDQQSPFAIRGYYITVMRMPMLGLGAWKKNIDAFASDGANTLVLWMAGGFRSRLFPETWQYNRDHANISKDLVRPLIDYAHTRGIRILLGFTPFGYDGVNRMGESRPEWRAVGADGKTTARFGIHSWGYNLCPAREDTQQFMRRYIHEMLADFYPNADGLFIESSDYAACHCANCGPRYYDNEFQFVRGISNEVWSRNPRATIVVYPHYFTGATVPGLHVAAAKQPFDPRWMVVFTPHSAPPNANLIQRAAGTLWSDDSPALRTPDAIRANAFRAAALNCTGYLPSLESFSYIPTEVEAGRAYLKGKRRIPFGFGWLRTGQTPYESLPVRIIRIAYREYSRDPSLSETAFRERVSIALFGKADPSATDDALELHRICAFERSWWEAAPLLSPQRVKDMEDTGRLTTSLRKELQSQLTQIQGIVRRYSGRSGTYKELHDIARWIDALWAGDKGKLLAR